jgi:hypothetical protein
VPAKAMPAVRKAADRNSLMKFIAVSRCRLGVILTLSRQW